MARTKARDEEPGKGNPLRPPIKDAPNMPIYAHDPHRVSAGKADMSEDDVRAGYAVRDDGGDQPEVPGNPYRPPINGKGPQYA